MLIEHTVSASVWIDRLPYARKSGDAHNSSRNHRAYFESLRMPMHLPTYNISMDPIPFLLTQLKSYGIVKQIQHEDSAGLVQGSVRNEYIDF